MASKPHSVRYGTVVIDPPWTMPRGGPASRDGFAVRDGRPSTISYPTMNFGEIAALPVRELAARRAHLYLWTVNAHIEDAYELVRRWGFRPSTLLTWCKTPNGIGLGGTYSLTTEHVLFARRGICPAAMRVDTTWWHWRRGQHSVKPEAFLDLVERVSPAPRLEMFARRNRLGWDTWGNEALEHIEVVA